MIKQMHGNVGTRDFMVRGNNLKTKFNALLHSKGPYEDLHYFGYKDAVSVDSSFIDDNTMLLHCNSRGPIVLAVRDLAKNCVGDVVTCVELTDPDDVGFSIDKNGLSSSVDWKGLSEERTNYRICGKGLGSHLLMNHYEDMAPGEDGWQVYVPGGSDEPVVVGYIDINTVSAYGRNCDLVPFFEKLSRDCGHLGNGVLTRIDMMTSHIVDRKLSLDKNGNLSSVDWLGSKVDNYLDTKMIPDYDNLLDGYDQIAKDTQKNSKRELPFGGAFDAPKVSDDLTRDHREQFGSDVSFF